MMNLRVWCVVALSLTALLLSWSTNANAGVATDVIVETQKEGTGEYVSAFNHYRSHVTLYLDDERRTPAGWSTRKEHGAPADQPFVFQPGVNLITGWTAGVLQMQEGERALLHVPPELAYGERSMGEPDGDSFYIPPNSALLFDIEILGKKEVNDEL